MAVAASLVESAKKSQKSLPLPCKDCSFDEALFRIVKDKLKQELSDVSGLGTIPEDSAVFIAFRKFVISQIEATVDVAIQAVFASDDLLTGHQDTQGRRQDIVSPKHDVLERRARELVTSLEPHHDEIKARYRRTGVRVTVANTMNQTNWSRIAYIFWRHHTPAA